MTYDELFTFENLYQAHLQARKCKRNKKDVISFELNLSSNLCDLCERLKNRTYKVDGYYRFNVYEPKKREIQALQYKDRVVQHVLCDLFLYPLLVRHFVYDNCACQQGKGTDFAIKRLTRFFADYYKKYGNNGYILKADIHHYFPSIDHTVLKNKLYKLIDDKDIWNLTEHIIDSYNYETGKGVPMGNQTSQLFALFYLDEVDRLVKEGFRYKYYIRYMDDIIILYPDKLGIKSCLSQISDVCDKHLKLQLNSKTQIIKIKNGVDFLGFHFYLTDTGKVIRKLRNSSKKKYKKRMKKLKTEYNNGQIDLDKVKHVLPGYKGHLSRGHTYYLQTKVLKDFVLINPNIEEYDEEEI